MHGRIIMLVALALAVRPALADDPGTAEHPLGASKLVLSDGKKPAERRIVFTARFAPGAAMENPTFAGATLRVWGATATDGDTGVIDLSPARWHALGKPPGSKGYVYKDPTGSAGGVELLMVKQGKHGGALRVVGGKGNWGYGIAGPQGDIALTFTIGKARWCASFTSGSFMRNAAHRVRAQSKNAPASCPCDRQASTFAAIQAAIFERHQCTEAACHGSTPGQANLDLRSNVAYANLVGVPSTTEPDKQRVAIGLASDSELFRKLAKGIQNLTDVPGAAMPSGLPSISASELEAVRLWIHSGAPQTGVVSGTENLLGSCLPPADPIKIPPPPVPAADQGIQLHAPPWKIYPRDPSIPGHRGEDEVCYATWYDFSAQIPAADQAPCPDFFGGPTKQCFYYDRSDLTQDPDSHHSIIHAYKGAYDITDDFYTCAGGSNKNKTCDPSAGGTDCPGGTCQAKPAFGPFACLGGPNEGLACNPKGIGVPAPAGADCGAGSGCAGRVQSTIACIGYGPPDFGFDISGAGSNNAPAIGGSQQPVSSNVYPPEVFSMLPVKGTIVWNSHAFNLTTQLATNEQWLNLFFAPPSDRVYPVQGIFDATDIFVMDVPPFQKHEYCRTYTLPQHARLFQLSSHTHKRGKLFRIWGPGITDVCGSEPGRTPDGECPSESTPPIFTTTIYSDPEVLYFDPPVALDDADAASRTYKFCSLYDNGATDPSEVKRQSTSPLPPIFGGLESVVGGPCTDATVACLGGPHQGELCQGNNALCDSAPGLGDGVCDACPVHGGVTTEDEMFILLGFYYVVP